MPTVTYPLDTSGVNPTNLVRNEVHTTTEAHFRDYYFIVPNFAPFFVDNFKLVHLKDGNEYILEEDVDFSFALPYVTGTRVTGKQMYGAITLNNLDLNGILKLDYQTIGGDQICDRLYVLTYLADKAYNPRTTVWDKITNVPTAFPPVPHYQDYDDFKGQEALVAILGEVRDAIITNSSLTTQKVQEFLDLFTSADSSLYVNRNGDEMRGRLVLQQPPIDPKDAVPKSYVDLNFTSKTETSSLLSEYARNVDLAPVLAGKLSLSGGTMTGPLTLDIEPVAEKHPTTKKYVDDKVTELEGRIEDLNTIVSTFASGGATKAYVDARINEIMIQFLTRNLG